MVQPFGSTIRSRLLSGPPVPRSGSKMNHGVTGWTKHLKVSFLVVSMICVNVVNRQNLWNFRVPTNLTPCRFGAESSFSVVGPSGPVVTGLDGHDTPNSLCRLFTGTITEK